METDKIAQSILENIKEPVYVRDLEKNLLYINPASEKLTRWSLAEALDKKCFEVFGDDKMTCKDMCPVERSILHREHIFHHEGQLKTKNGDIRKMQVSISPLIEEETVAGAIVVMEDITKLREIEQTNIKTLISLEKEIWERKQVERALTESEERLESFYQGTFEGIIIVEDGKIVDINKQVARLLKFEYGELIGMDIERLVADEDKEVFQSRVQLDYEKPYEIKIVRKDGTVIQVEAQGRKITYNGCPARVKVIRDVTERKKAEEFITASLKEKETLLQEIHHRVKNNMSVISSLLSVQAQKSNDIHIKEILQDSRARVQAMSTIHEMLYQSENLSSIKMQPYLLRLGRMVLQNYGIHSQPELKIETDDVVLEVKQASPLGLIVNEFLSNTLKYAFPDGEKGHIRITLQKNKKQTKLEYADNGIGIPNDFDWQNSKSLGLQLVKLLCEEQLGGGIELYREQGTRFVICFEH